MGGGRSDMKDPVKDSSMNFLEWKSDCEIGNKATTCLKPEIQLKNVDFPHEPEASAQNNYIKSVD